MSTEPPRPLVLGSLDEIVAFAAYAVEAGAVPLRDTTAATIAHAVMLLATGAELGRGPMASLGAIGVASEAPRQVRPAPLPRGRRRNVWGPTDQPPEHAGNETIDALCALAADGRLPEAARESLSRMIAEPVLPAASAKKALARARALLPPDPAPSDCTGPTRYGTPEPQPEREPGGEG